jgi:hypothetical protein
MDRIRTNLAGSGGFMGANDRFLVYRDFPDDALIQLDPRFENRQSIEKVLTINDQGNTVSIVPATLDGDLPSFTGLRKSWFNKGNIQIQALLNQEAAAQAVNADKFQPYMVDDIRSTVSGQELNAKRAIICQKGSIIEFVIQSWGAAGFGYSCKSLGGTPIVNDIYAMGSPGNTDRFFSNNVRRYETSGKTIVVNDIPSLEKTTGRTIDFSTSFDFAEINIKTWLLTSFKRGDVVTTSNTLPPASRRSDEVVINAESVEIGAPREGTIASDAQYVPISEIKEDRSRIIGDITFTVMVFKDEATARRIIDGPVSGL